jgi:hypothetical protein
MDDEMVVGINIATTMIVVGIVLSLIFTSIGFGALIRREAVTSITNGVSFSYSADLDALSMYGEKLPAASVYIALAKNREAIVSISGSAHGVTVTSIEDITKLFKYKITTTITELNEAYSVVIGE